MTTTQQNEYMKNVKWTTAGIVFTSTISIIVTLVWFFSDIKSDIKDTRTSGREQITAVSTAIRKTIDSIQNLNNEKFQSIADELWVLESPKTVPHVGGHLPSYYTQKFTVDSAGNRTYRFIPHK